MPESIEVSGNNSTQEIAPESVSTSPAKSVSSVRQPQFIPALKGKKIKVRLINGQPLVGVLLGYNSYEMLIDVQGQKQIVFKHSIVSIEGVGR